MHLCANSLGFEWNEEKLLVFQITIYTGVCVCFSTEKNKTVGPRVSSAAFRWRSIVFHAQWSINKSKDLRKSVFVTDRRSRGPPVCMRVGHSSGPFISIYFRLVSPSRLLFPYLSFFYFILFFVPAPPPHPGTTRLTTTTTTYGRRGTARGWRLYIPFTEYHLRPSSDRSDGVSYSSSAFDMF